MKWVKKLPIYCVLFSAYPALALMSYNITEDSVSVLVRPLVVSICIGLIFFFASRLIYKENSKAGLFSLALTIVFFSFGHILQLLEDISVLHAEIGRIRTLAPLAILLIIIAAWGIKKISTVPSILTTYLNIVAIFLVVIPSFHIISYITSRSLDKQTVTEIDSIPEGNQQDARNLPDIYYIILDSYTRQDVLLDVYKYDNQPFLDQLRDKGFYIADCSKSNYEYTLLSFSSSLNMDYLDNLDERFIQGGYREDILKDLIQQSKVRSELQGAGYKFISIKNSYIGTEIPDADEIIQMDASDTTQFSSSFINPFEEMFIKTTAAISLYRLPLGPLSQWITRVSFPYYERAQVQLFQLDILPQVTQEPGPKFVFVHMNIPHRPFIFTSTGELQTDPGYYSLDGQPINKEYRIKGYRDQIIFLNSRIPAIVDAILSASKQKPVIIIQGDHGIGPEARSYNLSAFYFPDSMKNQLYPDISPVNTFRVVLNGILGKNYPLLPDRFFSSGDNNKFTVEEIFETNDKCIK